MPHQRTLIRRAVVAALLEKTAAAERIFATQILPQRALRDLPSICVYTPEDETDDDTVSTAPRDPVRRLEIIIEGAVGVPAPRLETLPLIADAVEDAQDDLALEIERAMEADVYLGDTVGGIGVVLDKTELPIAEEGDRMIGIVRMTYSATYNFVATEEGTADEFLRAGVVTKVVPVESDDDDAEDLFEVRA